MSDQVYGRTPRIPYAILGRVADPELSSLASSLDDIRKRVAALAEQHDEAGQSDLAVDLYEVERSLVTGVRRLSKLLNERP